MPARSTALVLAAGALALTPLGSALPIMGSAGAAQPRSATTTGAGATTTGAGAAESSNPINDEGSSYHYRSLISAVTPNTPGLNVQVLEFADRLLLTNHTGRTVTIYGYSGEPYARILANGTAEQNTRAPATYLNTNFYGDVNVPPSASASAPPRWQVVDRTGEFEWHDHRIHWMSPVPPPQVKDRGRRTLVFDWRVPIQVGTQSGAVSGQLFWAPEGSKVSPVVIGLGVLIVLGGLAFVVVVRRRRSRAGRRSEPGAPIGGAGSGKEAW